MSSASNPRAVEAYRDRIKQIADEVIASQKLDGTNLINILEDLETDINISPEDYSAEHAVFHIIGYLLNWDSINLRFLWKRLPNEIKALAHLKVLYNIEKVIWKKEYKRIIPTIKEVITKFSDQETIFKLLNLVEARATREMIKFLSENFTTISLAEFSEIFSLSSENAKKLILQNNWKVLEDGFVEIDYSITDKNMLEDLSKKQLDQITEMVGFLESLI